MIRITQEQYDYFDKAWVTGFYAKLFGYLSEHFPDYPEAKREQLFDEYNASRHLRHNGLMMGFFDKTDNKESLTWEA